MQMGQRDEVAGVGAGTVWIGRRVEEDIGGVGLVALGGVADGCGGRGFGAVFEGGEDSETVFVVGGG